MRCETRILPGFLRYKPYFFEWQLPLMGQLPQWQPQEDFPFLRLRTIPAMMLPVTNNSRTMTPRVPPFAASQDNITIPPSYFLISDYATLAFSVNLVDS